ncbi:hypothetical protein [Actinoplanes italicus]|uniref:Uncharacterized protein n=1 Tax=Actinoplanes italicus TaxID=113567 RepID=A0A2T0JIE3_9ACTN|nr:hypothetical protein [Actinoplanes italicus]PRX07354.1 hypothetical protein CLV67_14229 [Actinoplanes italicus]
MEGREPAETTVYEYADAPARPWWLRWLPWRRAPRLVRAVTTREPLYTEQDREELLAYAIYREGLCPVCGGALEECTSHEATGIRFKAHRLRCRRRDAVLRAAEELENPRRPEALVWSTTTIRR